MLTGTQVYQLISLVCAVTDVGHATLVWNSLIVCVQGNQQLSLESQAKIDALAKQYNLSVCYQ